MYRHKALLRVTRSFTNGCYHRKVVEQRLEARPLLYHVKKLRSLGLILPLVIKLTF